MLLLGVRGWEAGVFEYGRVNKLCMSITGCLWELKTVYMSMELFKIYFGPAKTLKIDQYRCVPLRFSSSDLNFTHAIQNRRDKKLLGELKRKN